MTPVDFFFESCGPLVILVLVHRWLALSDVAIVLSLCVSGFQTAIAHSSISHHLLPDSRRHFLHHSQHRVNYGDRSVAFEISLKEKEGIGFADLLAGTEG